MSEREKIVAWLREMGRKRLAQYPFRIADAIERGEHLNEGEEG